ncbi:hypothetical protein D3C85_774430 [compost metagenome]
MFAQGRRAAHQGRKQRHHRVPHRAGTMGQISGLGLAQRQQIVHAIHLGDERASSGIQGLGARLHAALNSLVMRREHARRRGRKAVEQYGQAAMYAAAAEHGRHQRQANHADQHGRATPHHLIEGAFRMLHGAVGRQAHGIARQRGAIGPEMTQQRHANHAHPQPYAEPEQKEPGHLAEGAHQHEGRQHPDQRAQHPPHPLADHAALDRVDDEQHAGSRRVGRVQFQQIGHHQGQASGQDRTHYVGCAWRRQIKIRQSTRQAVPKPGKAWRDARIWFRHVRRMHVATLLQRSIRITVGRANHSEK